MNEIAIDRLHELFRLDAETGNLYWRASRGNHVKAGDEAGSQTANGYRELRVGENRTLVHRVIFAMIRGRWPAADTDHINGIKADNRPENLREATRAQNIQNSGLRSNNTSGIKGVSWYKPTQKWRAQIQFKLRPVNLGYYDDIELAELVVSEARLRYYGEFARVVNP